jgi:hypothetical protein
MPTKCALDLRHVGDERRWLVVAPCLGTEMDEFPCVEVICYPLDDLAHGNAATGSDIERRLHPMPPAGARAGLRHQVHKQNPAPACRRSR